MLYPPDALEEKLLLSGQLLLHSLLDFPLIVALLGKEVSLVEESDPILEDLLSSWPFFVHLFGKALQLCLVPPLLEVVSNLIVDILQDCD